MKTTIVKELLPMKAHYFLFNAGTAPVVPFMPTLARQLGFSTVVVGTMYTILPVVGMLAKPFFGFIADRYQRHRLLFLLAQVLTAISFFLIMFIPALPQQKINFHCHNGESFLRHCSDFDKCIETNLKAHFDETRMLSCNLHCHAEPYMWDIVCENWGRSNSSKETDSCPSEKPNLDVTVFINMSHILLDEGKNGQCLWLKLENDHAVINGENMVLNCPKTKKFFNTTCDLECDDMYLVDQLNANPLIENSDVIWLYQFWLFFILLITSWIGMAVVVSIGDAICFTLLNEHHHLYGNQRLWGAVGFGVFSIIAGVLVDKMSGDSVTKNYNIVFWMTAIIMGFDVLASSKLSTAQTHVSSNILKDVGRMFLSIRIVVFFVWCILIGLCTAMVWNFLFWHLEDLGDKLEGCEKSMKTLQGLAMGIQCFGGELPFFFLSGSILKKIGHINAMSLVLLGFGVRFMLYSMLQNPWYVLPIEMMNGITFGIFYSTMASYASIVAPPGTEATLQGLVGAIFEGIGVSTGSLVGGIMISKMGGSVTFQIFGICAFCAFVIHVVVQWVLMQSTSSPRNGKQAVENSSVKDVNGDVKKASNCYDETQFTEINLNS